MTRLITQQERRLTAAEFQQLAEVLVDIEWFANFEIRTDGFRPRADNQLHFIEDLAAGNI